MEKFMDEKQIFFESGSWTVGSEKKSVDLVGDVLGPKSRNFCSN